VVVTTTNKVTSVLDLNTIEKYIKNIDIINSDKVIAPRLLQSKSYLKILSIFYLIKDTNVSITANIIENVIQSTYIFNNIILVLKPGVIKVSSKSNLAVIWINIWDLRLSH